MSRVEELQAEMDEALAQEVYDGLTVRYRQDPSPSNAAAWRAAAEDLQGIRARRRAGRAAGTGATSPAGDVAVTPTPARATTRATTSRKGS